MKNRCTNQHYEEFHLYGGRGISVCDRWMQFENFIADMGPKPFPSASIDRIDTNGNYCPENCRWAGHSVQSRNKRNNRLVAIRGRTMIATEAAAILGIKPKTLHARLRRMGLPRNEVIDLDAEADRHAALHLQ